jgi:hypothetical protein
MASLGDDGFGATTRRLTATGARLGSEDETESILPDMRFRAKVMP